MPEHKVPGTGGGAGAGGRRGLVRAARSVVVTVGVFVSVLPTGSIRRGLSTARFSEVSAAVAAGLYLGPGIPQHRPQLSSQGHRPPKVAQERGGAGSSFHNAAIMSQSQANCAGGHWG